MQTFQNPEEKDLRDALSAMLDAVTRSAELAGRARAMSLNMQRQMRIDKELRVTRI